MSSEAAPVKPGDILAEKYRVDRVLGVGGMGVVVEAHHMQLEERVAIKFLLPDSLDNAEAVERFAREARAAVKIKSEHVARVTDVGTLSTKAPYMVMEYLEGEDLAQIIDRGPLPLEDAVDFVLQACEAIAEAHSLGIVHRDLKPANLFLIRRADGSRCVKVLDFGISKVSSKGAGGSGSDMSMTKTTAVMGSPLYMSPEQMRSARYTDARSDIWSLGVILYELITGDVPYSGDSLPELCMAVLTIDPPAASAKRAGVMPGLDRVIQKCLAREPAERYQDVGELAMALVEFAPKRSRLSAQRASSITRGAASGTVEPVMMDSIPAPKTALGGARTMAAWGKTGATEDSGKRMRLAAFGGGGAAIAALVAFALVRRPAETAPAVQPDPPPKVAAPAPPPRVDPPEAPAAVAPAVAPAATSAAPAEPAVAPAVTPAAPKPAATTAPALKPRPRAAAPKAASAPKNAADVFDTRK